MSSIGPNIGSLGSPDWSTPADSAGTDNKVPSSAGPSQSTEAQSPPSDQGAQLPVGFPVPMKAEASLDASAMKATVNAIPINTPTPQKHDYAAEAKAAWEANTSPAQKAAAAQNPLPSLKPFVGDHERAVEKAAGVFDDMPLVGGAIKLGHHIAEFVTGTNASGQDIDRSEKSREISREILAEVAGHVSGEKVGEFYGEAIGEVAGKGAGFIANKAVDHAVDKGVSHLTEAATKHIAGDDAPEE